MTPTSAPAPAPSESAPARFPGLLAWILVFAAAAWVVGMNIALVGMSNDALLPEQPDRQPYNLLVRGFESGHLFLPLEVPAEFQRLPDPYDPHANDKFRNQPPWLFHDLSYYGGHIYLYFGATPAVLAFWPWHLVTGTFLPNQWVVCACSVVGYLASALLLIALWRQRFPTVPAGLVAGALIVLGTATTVPMLDSRPNIWEVPISCAYALCMLALGAAWLSWIRPSSRERLAWLAAAGLAGGLAVGARPPLLFGATALAAGAALLGPSPGRRAALSRLLAAFVPMALIGLALAAYNWGRFGDPFQFGQHYQLSGDNVNHRTVFSAAFIPRNIRLYFFSFLSWSRHFPFAWAPFYHVFTGSDGDVEYVIGLLPNLPVLLFALAVPLAWRGRAPPERSGLRPLATIIGAMAFTGAAVLCLFYGTCSRYQVDYLPACALLACMGLFALDLRCSRWPGRRRAFRALAVVLIAYSSACSLCASLSRCGFSRCLMAGQQLIALGRMEDAIKVLQKAVAYSNGHAGFAELGATYLKNQQVPEAEAVMAEALRLEPGDPDNLNNLGIAELEMKDYPAAIRHLTEALQTSPTFAAAEANLGAAYLSTGQTAQAVPHLKRALLLAPGLKTIRPSLERALFRLNRVQEALEVGAGGP